METTDKLKLNKPGAQDLVDIEVINDNMDKIDQAYLDIDKIKVNSAKNADLVNGFEVKSNVPADAKFTDTITSYEAGTNIEITVDNVINAKGEELTKHSVEAALKHAVDADVPYDAVFTDTITEYHAGSNIEISEANVISTKATELTKTNIENALEYSVNANVPNDAVFTDTNTEYKAGQYIEIDADSENQINVDLKKNDLQLILGHSINSDVPLDAVFTDTNTEYTAGENITITEENVIHAEGEKLTKEVLESYLGHTIESDVPEGAIFTDTTYEPGQFIKIEGNVISYDDGATFDGILAEIIGDTSFSFAYGGAAVIKYNVRSILTQEVIANYYVDGFLRATQRIQNGDISFDIGPHLRQGTNEVRVLLTNAYGKENSLNYSLRGEVLRVTSYFNPDREYTGDIRFSFTPTGSLKQTAYIKVNGVTEYVIPVDRAGTQITQVIPALEHGGHTIEVYTESAVGALMIKSNSLQYTIVSVEEDNKTPIIASSYVASDKTQGELISIPYKVYTPDFNHSDVKLYINGEVVGELNADRTLQVWYLTNYPTGAVQFSIETGEVIKTYDIYVEPSDIDIEAVDSGLELFLTSEGKSNVGIDKEEWKSGDIEAQLTGFNFSNNGWIVNDKQETVLRLSGDARVHIPFSLFEEGSKEHGSTIEIEFMVSNVSDYLEELFSCMSGDIGIVINGQEGIFSTSLMNDTTSKALRVNFKEDEKIRMAFVIEPSSSNRLIYIYLNGIISGVFQYGANDNFTQLDPVGIDIGSNYADIDIYSIRKYDTILVSEQILNNYIAETRNLVDKTSLYTRNDIFDDFSNIDYNSILNQLPSLTVLGDLPAAKGNKRDVSLYFKNLFDPNRDFDYEFDLLGNGLPQMDVQGTSSQFYPRKNYKMWFPEDYKLRESSIPESAYTMKADYMDSSHALNTGLAKVAHNLLTKITPLPPQLEDPTIRHAIDGFPIVIFQEDPITDERICLGAYNFNNDEKNAATFGYPFNDTAEVWEGQDNSGDRTNFKNWDTSDRKLKDDWDGRFEKYSDTTAINRVGSWISSTEGDIEKFINEYDEYIDLDSFISYYLFVEIFGMVDSLAKNLFLATWDKMKWYTVFYDLDTAIGLNNEGVLTFPYNIEVGDVMGTANVWNGDDSVLWANIVEAFPEKIEAMYKRMRTNGIDYKSIVKTLIDEQIHLIPEALYNYDSQYKYIDPLINEGIGTYLYIAQGSRENHIKWWVQNRLEYLDSKYNAEGFKKDFISMRMYSPKGDLAVPLQHDFDITLSEDQYIGMLFGSVNKKERAVANKRYTILAPPSPSGFNDTETVIYGASAVSDIGDLAGKYVGTVDVSAATKLRRLKVGSGVEGYQNTNLLSVTTGNNKLLREIDVRGCPNLTTLNLSACNNIEEIYATGTSITSVDLPVGGILKEVHLPETIVNLTVRGHQQITDFTLDSYANISQIRIENSKGIPLEDLILNSPKLERVRLLGTELQFTNAEPLLKIMKLKGLDQGGSPLPKPVVTGKFHLDTVKYSEIMTFKEVFPELTITYDVLDYDFTIKFVNWDGTTLDTQYLKEGEYAIDPTDPLLRKVELLPIPARPSDGDDSDLYEYVFSGWKPNFDTLQEDAVIKAEFTHDEAVIRFVNWNGEELQVLDRQAVKPGVEIPTDPITREIDPIDIPTRLDSETESYTFSGWDTELTTFVKHTTISAEYDITSLHTVTFINWDGDILEVQKVLEGGDAIAPETPSRPDDGNTRYEFSSWNNDFTEVTEDRTIRAEYTFTKFYIVTFLSKDGDTIYTEEVMEGESAKDPLDIFYSPQPTETEDNYYSFWKWDKEFDNITQDTIVTELYSYTPKFLVRFLNHDGSVLKETKVVRGNAAIPPEGTPKKEKDDLKKYLFLGWNKSFNNIQSILDVTAEYDGVEYFTVTFRDYLGGLIEAQEINKGRPAVDPVSKGADLHRPGDDESDIYTFMGWDKVFTHVYDNMTIYPEYFAGIPSQFPGPVNIIGGDMTAGFYGEVSPTEFFSPTELAREVKIAEGTAQFNDTPWLKFAIDGRIIYRTKKPIRHSVSFNTLKDLGLLDGSTTVVKNGITYKVRLMRDGYSNAEDVENPNQTIHDSEWNRLMLPIHEGIERGSWDDNEFVGAENQDWGIGYTDLDLHLFGTTNGVTQWTYNREVREVPSEEDGEDMIELETIRSTARGYYGAPHWEEMDPTTKDNSMGWSPVLEVVLPGPTDLVGFYNGAGFYGETSVLDLYTGLEIANEIGLTYGIAQFSEEPWLKFVIDGRIIYKSKKSYRYSIHWDAINAVNAVYGDLTLMNKGIRYKVRLMSTSLQDKLQESSGTITHGSEYNRLIYPIHENAKTGLWNYPDNVEDFVPDWGVYYKDIELNVTTANGRSQWMQEEGSAPDQRIARGVHGVSRSLQYEKTTRITVMGWSPVLEVY